MPLREMTIHPIFWGDWWLPVRDNDYNWGDVFAAIYTAVTGRYMDELNQYNIGRGRIGKVYVHTSDPPSTGWTDYQHGALLKLAIDEGHIESPFKRGKNELPFYCVIVKPGIEHMNADGKPEPDLWGYHFPFVYELPGLMQWSGQACWVKGQATAEETAAICAHEFTEAYAGSEIADMCEQNPRVQVDGVRLPQYFSQRRNACWPQNPIEIVAMDEIPSGPIRRLDP
jgi:hypothetical protein